MAKMGVIHPIIIIIIQASDSNHVGISYMIPIQSVFFGKGKSTV